LLIKKPNLKKINSNDIFLKRWNDHAKKLK